MSSPLWSARRKPRAAWPPLLRRPRARRGPTVDGPFAPSRVGEYHVLGGLGVCDGRPVYLAQGPDGERVAARVLGHDTHTLARSSEFTPQQDEASVQRVAHFCNADVRWVGVEAGVRYLVTRFDGYQSLPQLVEATRSLADTDLHHVALTCLSALAALHRAGRVHGAFLPANVLIGAGGPVVIDFELDPDPAVAAQLELAGPSLGSFTTPEQVLGSTVGPAADLFAWASTMVYAATGHPPFPASNEAAQKQKVAYWHPELIAVPLPLANILGTCLSKDPERRPSAEESLLWLVDNGQADLDHGSSAPAAVLEMVQLARSRRSQDFTGGRQEPPPTEPIPLPEPVASALIDSSSPVGNAAAATGPAATAEPAAPATAGPPAPSATGPAPAAGTEPQAAATDRSGIAPRPARVGRRLGYLGTGLLVIGLMLGASKALVAPSNRPSGQQQPMSATGTPTAASPSDRGAAGGLPAETTVPPRMPTAAPSAAPATLPGPQPGSRGPSPVPSPSASRTPSGPTVPPGFAGTWIGALFQPPGAERGNRVTITMSSGARTAAYTLPTLGCQAVLTVTGVSRQQTQLQLVEHITRDPRKVCAATARLTLTLGGNLRAGQRQLTVRWQDAADRDNTAAGTLTRQ